MARLDPAVAAESGEPTGRVVDAWMREHSVGWTPLAELARRGGLSAAHFGALFRRRYEFRLSTTFLRLKIRKRPAGCLVGG